MHDLPKGVMTHKLRTTAIGDDSHSDRVIAQSWEREFCGKGHEMSPALSEGTKHIPSPATLCSTQPHACPSLGSLSVLKCRVYLIPRKEESHTKKPGFILALENTSSFKWPLSRPGNWWLLARWWLMVQCLQRLLEREGHRQSKASLRYRAKLCPRKAPKHSRCWLGLTIPALSNESNKVSTHPSILSDAGIWKLTFDLPAVSR